MKPANPIFVTGAAGFIGFHVARRLIEEGYRVTGVDGMTPYYDPALKRDRLAILEKQDGFAFQRFMLEDCDRLRSVMAAVRPEIVIHLAAQPGVRYSLENPRAYVDSNIVGTFNLLECCRAVPPRHLLLASTSSVYGDGKNIPFTEDAETSQPLSLYAASKKATEVMAHSYANLYSLPITVFRFFTVYGPWGRPDMAIFKFTAAVLEDREVEIYGQGEMSRDFTYIDDLVGGIVGLMTKPPSPADASRGQSPVAPFRVVNIGASQPVGLEDFVKAIERAAGRKARRKYLPMQAGDVRHTYADTSELLRLVGDRLPTPLDSGVRAFVEWYRSHYAGKASSGESGGDGG